MSYTYNETFLSLFFYRSQIRQEKQRSRVHQLFLEREGNRDEAQGEVKSKQPGFPLFW